MNEEKEYLDIAGEIMGVPIEEVPPYIKNKLSKIQEMLQIVKPYGTLHSTQIISLIIYDYLEEKT